MHGHEQVDKIIFEELVIFSLEQKGSLFLEDCQREGHWYGLPSHYSSPHLRSLVIHCSHAPPAAPPSLQSPGLPSQSLKQDQRLSILCSITAGDEPIVMSWQKDGEPILAGQDSGVEITMIEHDSILRISRLQGRHMGNYSCRADNEAGTAVVHSFIQVKGMFASF